MCSENLNPNIVMVKAYADYYSRVRTHLALEKASPRQSPAQATGSVVAIPLLGGLQHKYARMA